MSGFSSRPPENQSINGTIAVEVHEICHSFQGWNSWQLMTSTDRLESDTYIYYKYFDNAIGFDQDERGFYILPKNHIYNYVYGGDTVSELFAELCMLYAFEKMGLPNARL